MATRIVRVWDDEREVEHRISSFTNRSGDAGKNDQVVEFELRAEERYVVWPENPRARPKLRGRVCTFRRLVQPRADDPHDLLRARVFFDDGSWAAVDITDLLPEAHYRRLAEEPQ